ncbi:MAG: tripartite tricarboxylate transporter substrate binding protein [Burkholderiaceae bacterium]|nr:tripartite tricarboxylate transporter substrate binding protein [Burkholderiaceae bacterium]
MPLSKQGARRRRLTLGLAGAGLLPGAARATAWPAAPVRLVVPFPPGGTVDTLTRLLAPALAAQLGQQVLVDNRGGANGTLGSKHVAQARADGLSLLLTASNQIINPLILRTVPYDALADFTAISYIGYVPQLLVVHNAFPAANLTEFLAQVRAQPGRYSWATSGMGTAGHLAEELINQRGQLKMPVIPYRGGGPALTDTIAGHTAAMVEPIPSALPHVLAGRLRVLAVTSPKRAAALPQVPTIAESGLADFDLPSWYGLWGPAGLPAEIVQRVHAELRASLQAPAVKARLEAMSFEALGGTPEALLALMKRDTERFRAVVKDAGIVAD